ncbi:MAG: sodium-dependent transporter [Candidatus Hydrogenedentota bacterium]|nr:MAG: sodium-dependent transporter [Candidatus Hydrogenedentota bacterium]
MSDKRESQHGLWSSRWTFILAATGSAVGLGNIWKFPYIAGENGGGAFVLIYLLCIAFIGIPVLMAEILIGRRGRQSPDNAVAALAKEAGVTKHWRIIGYLGIVTAYLILTFYVVIAGWGMNYVYHALFGHFQNATPDEIGALRDTLFGSPTILIFWTTIVLAITVLTVGRGVQKGLEMAASYLMPGMFLILLILLGYSLNTGHFMEGASFLFRPDFSKITPSGVLQALGHAFFTLSLASGAMMAYGAYLPEKVSIAQTSIIVALADTMIALIAGLVIFPICFTYGLEPDEGPALIFISLPIAFGQMPFGLFFGTLFFIMLVFAAITSAIALLEPSVVWLMENRKFTRGRAASLLGGGLWILSLGTVFSLNYGSDITLFGKTYFDNVDYLTANILMPLGGLLVALFTGWAMKEAVTREELDLHDHPFFAFWLFTMRFVAPVLILIVFLNAIGILNLS